MWICKDCGEVFEEPETEYEHHSEVDFGYEKWIQCPACGSSAIEDADRCPLCGEYKPSDEDWCKDCEAESISYIDDFVETFNKRFNDKDFLEEMVARYFGW